MAQTKSIEIKRFPARRYQEIDFFRAVAIVLMMAFHLVYDLNEFGGINVDYSTPLWVVIGKTSALLFIVLSGLSCGLSRSPVLRGVKVLACGMGVTIVTFVAMKEEYVRFGILQFLGVAMILSPLFKKMSLRLLWALGVVILVLGFWFNTLAVQTSLLLPLGLMYVGFKTIDYYPLFPYLAATILGIILYRRYYIQRSIASTRGLMIIGKLKKFWQIPDWIQWLSRNSLGIYLVHQPIFLLIIFIINHSK